MTRYRRRIRWSGPLYAVAVVLALVGGYLQDAPWWMVVGFALATAGALWRDDVEGRGL